MTEVVDKLADDIGELCLKSSGKLKIKKSNYSYAIDKVYKEFNHQDEYKERSLTAYGNKISFDVKIFFKQKDNGTYYLPKPVLNIKERTQVRKEFSLLYTKYPTCRIDDGFVKTTKDYIFEPKAINLEKAIFNWSLKDAKQKEIKPIIFENVNFKRIYLNKCRTIIYNLTFNDQEDYIKNNVKTKDIPDIDIQRWKPELYTEIHAKMQKKDAQWVANHKDKQHTGIFKCGRCRSKNTVFVSLQTRSADEPMTNFITCLNCNNHWKE